MSEKVSDEPRDISFDDFAARLDERRKLGTVEISTDNDDGVVLSQPTDESKLPELGVELTDKGKKALDLLRDSVADSIANTGLGD